MSPPSFNVLLEAGPAAGQAAEETSPNAKELGWVCIPMVVVLGGQKQWSYFWPLALGPAPTGPKS